VRDGDGLAGTGGRRDLASILQPSDAVGRELTG
jgi:hypothetical protein